jgi:IS5 family transposase
LAVATNPYVVGGFAAYGIGAVLWLKVLSPGGVVFSLSSRFARLLVGSGAARQPVRRSTLGPVIIELEKLTGVETRRIHVDKGYRGHDHSQKFRVRISGQVHRATAPIRREIKRRAAVEPVIGHLKAEHRMDRNYLKGRDRINAVVAVAGYNFGLLLRWLKRLLRALIAALSLIPLSA